MKDMLKTLRNAQFFNNLGKYLFMQSLNLIFDQRAFVAAIFKTNGYRSLILGEAFALVDIDKPDASAQLKPLFSDRLTDRGKSNITLCEERHITRYPRVFGQ